MRIRLRFLFVITTILAVLMAFAWPIVDRMSDPMSGMLRDLGLPASVRKDLVRANIYIRESGKLFSLLSYPVDGGYQTRIVVFDPNSLFGHYFWLDEKNAETCGLESDSVDAKFSTARPSYETLKNYAKELEELHRRGDSLR